MTRICPKGADVRHARGHPTFAALPIYIQDAFHELGRAWKCAGRAISEADRNDPDMAQTWADNMPKIFAEIAATEAACMAALTRARTEWWAERRRELEP